MRAGQIVLVDTNIITEAVRTNCWSAIVGHFVIETVQRCCEEARTGIAHRPGYVEIDEAILRTRLAAHPVTKSELVALGVRDAEASRLDPGERELWAHALSRTDTWVACSCEGRLSSVEWLEREVVAPAPFATSGTPIEVALQKAIVEGGRLPEPDAQYEIHNDSGDLLTIPDFAYLDRKIAIYCDGFAYHGNVDSLAGDARKRNALQASGWAVLTFWGRQILRNPGACEAQIWQCYMYRHSSANMAAEVAKST